MIYTAETRPDTKKISRIQQNENIEEGSRQNPYYIKNEKQTSEEIITQKTLTNGYTRGNRNRTNI